MLGKSRSNQTVIDSWKKGKSWKNGSGSLSTDGSRLWSYSLVIAYTDPDELLRREKYGIKVVIDYMAPDNVTQTTSIHVSLAKGAADAVVSPDSRALTAIKSIVERA